MNEPIRVVRELKPVAIGEPKPGVFVFDLGQHIAGWCRLKLHASSGTTVRLRHAEVLQSDGMVYTSNLRTAQATNTCRMMLLREAPSFGYMIEHGGTTIWERWDGYIEGRGFGHPKMNSFNHPDLASVAAWVWKHVAGIQADEGHPGFKHFFIAPKLDGSLTWMKASYDSVRGRIE
jgi:hypothetical protein